MLGLAGALTCKISSSKAEPDPVFEGKSVSQWLDAGFEDSSRALHELGPAAIDAIFVKLNAEHPRYGRQARYGQLWAKLPWLHRRLPRPKVCAFDEWRACNALVAIGPRAIPRLTKALSDQSFLVRSTSAQALACFHERGSDLHAAFPALQLALQDRDPGVRQQAARALQR